MVACVQLLRCCHPGAATEFRALSSGENIDKMADRSTMANTDAPDEHRMENFGSSSDEDANGDEAASPVKRSSLSSVEQTLSRTRSLVNGRLLDEYSLGTMLGQGSFGIVFSCGRKGQEGTELAVKLVDKVEALPEDVAREVKILQKLDHPNILKVHEVVDEKCFVCIIADRYWGGDLVKGLKSHASSGKRIRSGKILHLVKQMLNAIAYLHSLYIVHRDIKADNYLLDRVSLMDSKCCVVLADFGFACECRLGDRLARRCGTKAYWPPELWDRSYTLKVDVWAMGVTLYGIVEGTFPFQTEWDVKHKEVSCHPLLSSKCADLIGQLLNKLEVLRPTAAHALTHKWMTGQAAGEEADIEWRPSMEAMRADEPDPGVAARRLELVERLEGVQRRLGHENSLGSMKWKSESSLDSANATPMTILSRPTFTVVDRPADKIRTFEWWAMAKIQSQGLLNITDESRPPGVLTTNTDFLRHSNVMLVGQMLEAHGIDTSLFGQGSAKPLERFADELESGASQLMMDAAKHKALVRVVDVVLLRLSCQVGEDTLYLIVSADEQLDGRIRSDLNRLPGTKKRPHENVRNAAERIVMEMPDVDVEEVTFNFDTNESFEEDEESLSYPGVRTVYRKEVVSGILTPKASACLALQGADARRHQSSRSTKFFTWLTHEVCATKQVKLSCAPKQGAEVSSLVPAPIGLKVKALGRFLKANNIDPSAFGRDRAKTLQELSTELIAGECSLRSLPDGGVVRIVDVVLLLVTNMVTQYGLVVTKDTSTVSDGGETALNRLPGTKRRPDENHFHAAKRVLQRQLKVPENFINLDASNVQIYEEEKDSPSYPGLRTVYCKRIISAELQVAPRAMLTSRSTATASVGTEGRPQVTPSLVRHAGAMSGR